MIPYVFELPQPGTVELPAREKHYLDFITETQLLDRSLWEHFVEV